MRYHVITTLVAGLAMLLGASAASATTIIERIEVESANVVRFHLSGPAEVRVVGLPPRLPVKARIAVDFEDTTLGPEARQPVPGLGAIIRVRPEKINNKTMVRAMIELSRGVGFKVERTDKTFTVHLETGPDVVRPDAAAPAAAPDAPPAS